MKKIEKVRKRRNRKLRKIIRIISRFFIFFSVIFLIIFSIKHSVLFKIKDINVSGINKVKREEILKKSKLNIGEKYYNISKKNRIKSIKTIAYVKNVKMNFKLGGTLSIKIEERNPYYQIQKKEFNLIDENFRILEKSTSKNSNLIDLYGVDIENFNVGDYILQDKDSVDKIELLNKLRDKKFNLEGNIKSIKLLDSVATFETVEGIKVEFGSYSNIEYKLNMLKLILQDIKNTGKNVSYIQMEKSENPIVVETDTKEEDIFDKKDSN